MSEPFIGEIRMFGGNYAPVGWALCDGRAMSIAGNEPLFALIGTTYGGDGQSTFNLPDLRGRLPVHHGTGPNLPPYILGEMGGAETVTLSANETAAHTHPFQATQSLGTDSNPAGHTLARITAGDLYSAVPAPTLVAMSSAAVGPGPGGNQPHDNVMPFLCASFIIALQGIFPQRD
jgi:microcystin-dependent protein